MGGDEHFPERFPGASRTSIRKLGLVSTINFVGFVLEFAGGIAFGSVALMGDALHMLFDSSAYLVALGAVEISRRSRPSGRWSYGLHRIEPFAAFLNGVLLVPMVAFLVYEAYERYRSPVAIDVEMTILLAFAGLLINLVSVFVLRGGEMSLNERGAFYHLLGDAGASVSVIVSMLVISATDLLIVDPITAVVIAGLIVWSAGVLLRESGAIFFQQSPVEPNEIRAALEALDGLGRVVDCHIWSLSSSIRIASVHVTDSSETIPERDLLVSRIHDVLRTEFGISHATVEVINDRHGCRKGPPN